MNPNLSESPSPVRRRALIALAELAFFLGWAVYSTWPLVTVLRTALPQGTETVATVPLFNLWSIWWNADRLAHGLAGYWNAPIFYPTQATFAFSEPEPVCLVVAPLVWLSDSPAAAYNVYLLLSLVLNGWVGAKLVREVTGNRWSGLAGGAMLLMLPIVHWQLGVLQLVPIWGVLWSIGALRKFGREPTMARALSLGVALAATYLSCAYYGLFLVLLLVGAGGWLLGKNLWNWRKLPTLIPGALICLALVSPVLAKQREIIRKFAFERPADLMMSLSAEVGDYSVTPWPQLLSGRDFADPTRSPYWQLGPGNIKWLLAAVAVIIGMMDRRLRLWTLFGITFTTLAILLSMGLKFHIGGWIPYRVLIDYFPGIAQARNVFRFALFAQLMVAVLAAQALEAVSPIRWRQLIDWWRARRQPISGGTAEPKESAAVPGMGRVWRAGGIAAALLVGGLAALEVRPPAQSLYRLSTLDEENSDWIGWLTQNTAADAVIACIPFPHGTSVDDYEETTQWMYWGTRHRRRMVNGYSGFFPPSYMNLKPKMDRFPDQASLDELASLDVRYCVVWRHGLDPTAWNRMQTWYSDRLNPLHWDETGDVGIFELVRDGAAQ